MMEKQFEEGDSMPAIEAVESERTAYIREMEEYLQRLKSMPEDDARRQARINLQNCNIIQEDGGFSERYRYSRLYAERKE